MANATSVNSFLKLYLQGSENICLGSPWFPFSRHWKVVKVKCNLSLFDWIVNSFYSPITQNEVWVNQAATISEIWFKRRLICACPSCAADCKNWGRGCCHLHRNFWYIILSELLYLYDYVVNPFNQDFPFWTSTQVFSVSRSLSYYSDWVSQCMSYTNRNECLSLQAFQFFENYFPDAHAWELWEPKSFIVW